MAAAGHEGDGALVRRPPVTAGQALARVAREAAEHLTGLGARHLGACADDDRAMLFLDPGGRRRWCSAAVCGVHHRVRPSRPRRRGDG